MGRKIRTKRQNRRLRVVPGLSEALPPRAGIQEAALTALLEHGVFSGWASFLKTVSFTEAATAIVDATVTTILEQVIGEEDPHPEFRELVRARYVAQLEASIAQIIATADARAKNAADQYRILGSALQYLECCTFTANTPHAPVEANDCSGGSSLQATPQPTDEQTGADS